MVVWGLLGIFPKSRIRELGTTCKDLGLELIWPLVTGPSLYRAVCRNWRTGLQGSLVRGNDLNPEACEIWTPSLVHFGPLLLGCCGCPGSVLQGPPNWCFLLQKDWWVLNPVLPKEPLFFVKHLTFEVIGLTENWEITWLIYPFPHFLFDQREPCDREVMNLGVSTTVSDQGRLREMEVFQEDLSPSKKTNISSILLY